MIKWYFPCNDDRILRLLVSAKVPHFVIQETCLLAIAFSKLFQVLLNWRSRCMMRDVCSRLDNNKRHKLEWRCELCNILTITLFPELFSKSVCSCQLRPGTFAKAFLFYYLSTAFHDVTGASRKQGSTCNPHGTATQLILEIEDTVISLHGRSSAFKGTLVHTHQSVDYVSSYQCEDFLLAYGAERKKSVGVVLVSMQWLGLRIWWVDWTFDPPHERPKA